MEITKEQFVALVRAHANDYIRKEYFMGKNGLTLLDFAETIETGNEEEWKKMLAISTTVSKNQ